MAVDQIQEQPDLESAPDVDAGIGGGASCLRCGRGLTNVRSIALGIGPDCLGKFGGTEAWLGYTGALTSEPAPQGSG